MKKAFNTITSGLYLVSTKGDKEAGCIINTFTRVASKPELVIVAVNKENYTAKQIQKSKKYNVTVLSENADMDIIKKFGFTTSADNNKYNGFDKKYDLLGLPYITDGMISLFTVRVKNEIDAGTHIVFLGEVSESMILKEEKPMTYDYYQNVKRGVTPPKAANYNAPEKISGYKCDVCGYIYRGEKLPDGYVCPICGQIHFTKISE